MSSLDLMRGLRRADGRRWGDTATSWQLDDAAAVLAADGPRRHWIGRPRGGSKTEDTAAMTLAAMLTDLPRGSMAYAAAADRDQARLIIDSVRGFVQATPGLASAVDVQQWRVLVPDRDVVLEVLAADAASAWGLRPAWLTLDELTGWPTSAGPRMFYDALTSALPKIPGSKSVVISTAGSPGHWTHRIYKAAKADRKRWRVSDQHDPAPWIDRAEIEGEKARLLPSLYARLWRNEWVQGEDRLVSAEDLDACTREDADPLGAVPGARYVISLDIGLTNDKTVACVCHREGDRVVLDRIAVWQGKRGAAVDLATVQAWIAQASKTYNRAPLIFDPFAAAQLTQGLRSLGVPCREFVFTAASVGKLALVTYRLLREHRLSLPADPELRDELLNVRLRESTPGVVRLDHDSGKHDDRAVSLALAAHELETAPPPPSFIFDDVLEDSALERHGGFVIKRADWSPDGSVGLDFGEGRDPAAGQARKSPYV